MRLQRRPQGRIPVRVTPTHWEIMLEEQHYWKGDSLVGVHKWLIEQKAEGNLKPDTLVTMWRNDRTIFAGPWQGLVADPTLW